MSPSYWKRRKEKRLERSRLGVLARERNRLAQEEAAVHVGSVLFAGPAFGGMHLVRAFARGEGPGLLIEVDGQAHRPRTLRGLVRLVSKRLWKVTP